MKHVFAWALLVSGSGWARPYRDAVCQVQFPGLYARQGPVASAALPHVRLYVISWSTPPSQATALLAQLYRNGSNRGLHCQFVTKNRAEGLQIVETLPFQRTQSQYFLTAGICYEFRACTDDNSKHPEVNAFFNSLQFRARTINLKRALTTSSVPARPASYSSGPAKPYEF